MELPFKPILSGVAPSDVKVVVAMSGGVDSSSIAAALHSAGYNVVGVTMQLYSGDSSCGSSCTGKDASDARQVALRIGFPHYVLNYENTFKKEVIDYFIDSYKKGETPIPCIMCNKTVKFRDLLNFTLEMNASALVTGHYAVVEESNCGQFLLKKAKDKIKDQSYFLFTLTSDLLSHIRFPLGDFTKDEVRAAARNMNLHVADKKESQDICFVNDKYTDFFDSTSKGEIIHIDKGVIGVHQGIERFTVGQRRGLNISFSEPLYVLQIDPVRNAVIVGSQCQLFSSKTYIRDVTWVSGFPPCEDILLEVKLRSYQLASYATVRAVERDIFEVNFPIPQKAVTPGQACVLYKDDILLGGGWIFKYN